MKSPHVRILYLEMSLRDIGALLAQRVMPTHEAAERIDRLARELAAIRRDMVSSAATHSTGENDDA